MELWDAVAAQYVNHQNQELRTVRGIRRAARLKEQEDAAMDKLANTYLNLKIAAMAGHFERHPGEDFTWLKELLLSDADFAAMDDDEEEASNDTRGAQQ
ncbi:hypothetical protein GH714_004203 [Hevea brasiliensis]|uniref:Uncharacterized protein n=1 Tax=Hevea brasiliensis TaxID=3981 RepID=A0A6A6MYV0_HEVBR|nr:hypothetical protein GH714_004203 [Hevea brasiliensis]